MTELVVISGKGGTGKTSIVASFAALADNMVLADCDVDAADLHLVLSPTVVRRESFSGGKRAKIDPARCTGCGKCDELCRFNAVTLDAHDYDMRGSDLSSACRSCSYCVRSCSLRANAEIKAMLNAAHAHTKPTLAIDPVACEGCGVCAQFCPADAIEMYDAVNGEWFVSDTRHGPMVHAALGVAEANSGKLVSIVRDQAQTIAAQQDRQWVLIDGSPGIGCPVIASITGADGVLIVTEPTLSGLHDLGRVAEVAKHFGVPSLVCINKWDINPDVTAQIEQLAADRGLLVAGRVRYDRAVTDAQIHKQAVVEYQSGGCSDDIRALWQTVRHSLTQLNQRKQGPSRDDHRAR